MNYLNKVANRVSRALNKDQSDAPSHVQDQVSNYCGWSINDENETGNSRADGVLLRRYPYPFRCALALNNDTDGFTHDAFEAFHSFVNGRGETPFGTGLGLEVSDSFWVWSTNKQLSLFHSAPWETPAARSPEHDRVLELAKLGWLDTLHGFGAWNEDWHLDRDRIENALDYLESQDINLSVYVSHGGFNMAHNYGGVWGYYQHADDPGHKSYCLDLLTRHGFNYFWSDPFYELDKFGEYQKFSSQEDLDEAVQRHDFARFFYTNDPLDYSKSREVFPGLSDSQRVEWKRRLFNRILVPTVARDGQAVFQFKRFRGRDGPMSGNFILQVNPDSLDELETKEAAVVVYQHFGIWRGLFMGKRHPSQRISNPEDVLDEHNIWAFRTLADRYNEGRVFVTTTKRLLDYLRIRDALEYSVRREEGKCVINIEALNCPVLGRSAPSEDILQGISFNVPLSLGDPIVLLDGDKLKDGILQKERIDDQHVVHFRWTAMEWPS